jgi:DNA-directed RNA polymerase subunit RPC12/RpoP
MPYPDQIARAEREGIPVKPLVCDGCGDEVKTAEQTPGGKIVCPGCKGRFIDETREAILQEFKGNVLFGFVSEDAVDEFLDEQLARLWEVG